MMYSEINWGGSRN